jgi:hypothetical protein
MAKKLEKLDKQTQKDIARVLGKYVDRSRKYMLPAVYTAAGGLNLIALGIDLIGGGGLATLTLNSVAIPTAFTAGGGYVLYSMRARERQQSNGQTILASEVVSDTLDAMETRLRHAFTKASQPDAPKLAHTELQFVLEDVATDLKTLAPAYKVVGGDDYIFIVETRKAADGTKEHISLARKLAEMQAEKDALTKPVAKTEIPAQQQQPANDVTPKPPPRRNGFQL